MTRVRSGSTIPSDYERFLAQEGQGGGRRKEESQRGHVTDQSAHEYGILGARKTPPVSPSVSHMLKKAFEGAGSTERKSDER